MDIVVHDAVRSLNAVRARAVRLDWKPNDDSIRSVIALPERPGRPNPLSACRPQGERVRGEAAGR